MGTSHLLDLPVELVELVCGHIPTTTSLKNLRLVCRELDAKTVQAFARRHIGVVNTSLRGQDLETLVEVSLRPSFASEVRHICIMPTYLETSFSSLGFCARTKVPWRQALQSGNPFEHDARVEHQKEVEEQTQYVKSGRDIKLLSEALSNLPCLTGIDVGCPYTGCREVDHPLKSNAVTGQLYLHSCSVGYHARSGSMRLSNVHHAFRVLVAALKPSNVKGLGISAGTSRSHGSLHSRLPAEALRTITTVPQQWGKDLRHIDLTLDLTREYLDQELDTQSDTALTLALSSMPSLQSLNIDLSTQFKWAHWTDSFTYAMDNVLQNVELPALKSLHLQRAFCHGKTFQSFLTRHAGTLKELRLRLVRFRDSVQETSDDIRQLLQLDCLRLEKIDLVCVGTEAGVLRNTWPDREHMDVCEHVHLNEEKAECRSCALSRVKIDGRDRIQALLSKHLSGMRIHSWVDGPARWM